MLALWLVIVALTAPPASPAVEALSLPAAQDDLRLQVIQIPDENLIAQIRMYLSGEAQPLSIEQFTTLLKRYREYQRHKEERAPTRGQMAATVNVLAGRLEGTAHWEFPKGESSRLSIKPWNLALRELRFAAGGMSSEGDAAWGASGDAGLVILGAGPDQVQLDMKWELQGTVVDGEIHFNVRIPPTVMSYLDVDVPQGWMLRPESTSIVPDEKTSVHRIFPSTTGAVDFVLTRLTDAPQGPGHFVYRDQTRCRFQDRDVHFQTDVFVDVIRGPVGAITLEVNSAQGPLRPSTSVNGDWTMEVLPDGVARWTFSSSSLPAGPLRLMLEGTIPLPIDGEWSPPLVKVVGGSLLSEEISFLIPSDLRVTGLKSGDYTLQSSGLQNDGIYQILYRGSGTGNRPSAKVARVEPRVESNAQMILDLRSDPIRAKGVFDIAVHAGEVAQLEAIVPAGWRFLSVETEPVKGLEIARSEPNDDGSTTVLLTLATPPTPDSKLQIKVSAELEESVEGITAERSLTLPEIKLIDVRSVGVASYDIYLDSNVPCNLDALPPAKPISTEEGARDVYSFSYLSPLSDAKIILLPAAPHFRGTLRQNARWRSEDWRQELTLDVAVVQGTLETLHVVSNKPLPADVSWKVVGADNSVVRFEPFPGAVNAVPQARQEPPMDQAPEEAELPPDAPAEFNYLLRTALPVRGNLRLTTSWTTKDPLVQLPLLQLPDADVFSASVEVASRTGRVIDVSSRGLVPTDPSRMEAASTDESGLIWMANYDRLEPGASLSLRVLQPERGSDQGATNRCFMRCRTLLEYSTAVHVVELTLENTRDVPLRLRLPKDSYVWQLDLDGVSISPGSQDGVLEATSELGPGSHDCRIVFSCPLDYWLGIARIDMPTPVPDWDVVCSIWKINRSSAAYLFPGKLLTQKSELVYLGDAPQSPIVDLMKTSDSSRTLQVLSQAFKTIGDLEEKNAGTIVSELSRAILPAGQVVIDSSSFIDQHVTHRADESLTEWLQAEEMVAIIADRSVVFTSRVPPFIHRNIRPNWNVDAWGHELIDEVRHQGMDRSGRFVAPGVTHFNNIIDESPWNYRASPRFLAGVSWTLAARGDGDTAPLYATVVPAELLTRTSRFLVFAGMSLVLLIGRRLSNKAHRVLLTVLLTCAFIAACSGGIIHHLLSVPFWAMTASSVLILVLRNWGGRTSAVGKVSTAALVLFLMASPAHADPVVKEGAAPPTDRVLVPIGSDGKAERVIVPERLLRRLEAIPSVRPDGLILRRGQYEARLTDNGRCQWRVTLLGFLESSSDAPIPVTLPFGGIERIRVLVDGVAVTFSPPGANVGLDFSIPPVPASAEKSSSARPIRIELEFDTQVVGAADDRSLSFIIPPSAETNIRLWTNVDLIELDPASAAEGWQESTIDGKQGLALIAGPTTRLNLRWRQAAVREPEEATLDVESIRLVEVGEQRCDLLYAFHLPAELTRRRLTFAVPNPLVVRSVDGDRVKNWRIEPTSPEATSGQLIVELDLGNRSPLTLIIRCQIPLDANSRLIVPDLVLEGDVKERGVLGVRTSGGWEVALENAENAETAPLAEFVAAWSRTLQEQVPAGISVIERFGPRSPSQPVRVSLALRPPKPQWRVDQQLAVQLDPAAGLTTMEITAAIHAVGHPTARVEIAVPPGVEILRVAGPDLFEWFRQKDEVTLLLRQPVTNETTVTLSTRAVWPDAGKHPMARSSVSLAPLQWRDAEALTNHWQIRTVAGWRVAPPTTNRGNDAVPTAQLTLSTDSTKEVTASLVPQERELSAESLTSVTVRDRETVIEGRIVINVRKGAVDELEFRTPAGLTNLHWDIENLPSPESSLQGDERVWMLRSARSIVGNLTVRWRTSKFYDTGDISVPHVVLRTKASVHEWVTLVNLTDRTLTPQYTGLSPAEMPESLLVSTHSNGAGAARARQSFLAERSDWHLAFNLAERPETVTPFSVLWAEGDTVEMPDGQIRGLMTWQIIDEADGIIEIGLPEKARIDRLQIDGDPLPLPDVEPGRVRIPVYRKGRRQRLSMQWSAAQPFPSGKVAIPRLNTTTEYPALLRFRHSSENEFAAAGDPIDRVQWLVARLAHAVDELSHRMERPSNPIEQAELAILVSRARAIQDELEPCLKAAAQVVIEPDGVSIVVDHPETSQANTLIQRFSELLVKMPPEWAQAGPEQVDRLLSIWREIEILPADHVDYTMTTSIPESFVIMPQTVWPRRTVTTNEWVRIGTAAAALLLVLNRRLWNSMQLYWPAPMLATGIAWAMFADTYAIGWVLVALAIAGLVWNVRRWFMEESTETGSTIIRGSTRLHRTTAAAAAESDIT